MKQSTSDNLIGTGLILLTISIVAAAILLGYSEGYNDGYCKALHMKNNHGTCYTSDAGVEIP